ncbi:MAG: glucosamine-6-phosphate deaminase [Eubacteriales bacterium]|nr:glucosamine-6-phosphate deaminase [Eubacteriales bacterium]
MGLAAAKDAAFVIKKLLGEKNEISVIFAAAPSQNDFLECLVADKTIDFRRINGFHMDEYVGLDPKAPQAFGQFLRDRLFEKVPFKSVNYINGCAADINAECERYASLLNDAKADIVCMGIGENGHIAFNDPHEAHFDDKKAVKIVSLDEVCRRQQVNDGCFEDISKVPTHAFTLTIPTLTAPEYIFCVVPASTKANAVHTLLNGDIGEYCPCTILRKHKNAILYTDKDSASRIL